MSTFLMCEVPFEASHQLAEPPCDREHGHSWKLVVTIAASFDPLRGSRNSIAELRTDVGSLARELDHRNLNAMLPGVVTRPEGVAAWAQERLLMKYPHVHEVAVWMGSEVCGIVR